MAFPKNQVPTIHLTNTTIVSTLTHANVGLAISYAYRANLNMMVYPRLILEMNDMNPRYDTRIRVSRNSTHFKDVDKYRGLPCHFCRRLIPIGTRIVRRRAGNFSKYLHCECYERVYGYRIPVNTEAEMESMKLGLYPSMSTPRVR